MLVAASCYQNIFQNVTKGIAMSILDDLILRERTASNLCIPHLCPPNPWVKDDRILEDRTHLEFTYSTSNNPDKSGPASDAFLVPAVFFEVHQVWNVVFFGASCTMLAACLIWTWRKPVEGRGVNSRLQYSLTASSQLDLNLKTHSGRRR